MTRVVIATLLIAILPLCAVADWSTMGGNSQRDGRAAFVGPDDATQNWTFNDPCLFAGPIYTEGDYAVMMRFHTIDYSPILCLNVNDGGELWSRDLPGETTRSLPIGFRDGQVYALGFQETGQDTLYALDPADGSVIWTAESLLHQGIIASAAFADNGDLIVNGVVDGPHDNALTRIDHLTGETVWQTERVLSVVGGSEHVCVYGNRIYGWEGGLGQVEFTTWALDTGIELYGISLPGDGDQEIPFTVAADSAIYIIRDGGDLFRLRDTGTGFEIVWQQPVEFGQIPPVGGHFAVLSDGDVIVPHGNRIRRHEAGFGFPIETSDELVAGTYMGYPRFAVDSDDTIYMSTSTSDGRLIAFRPNDLTELWSFPISNIHYAGPAVGRDGDIITAGAAGVYCFDGESGEVNLPPSEFALLSPMHGAHLVDVDVNHSILFDWEDSIDPEDNLTYTLFLEHRDHPEDDEILIQDLTESEFAIGDSLFDLAGWEADESFINILWGVVALDGAHAIMASNAPFELDYEIAGDGPSDFALVAPEDGSSFTAEEFDFVWTESVDPDDDITYELAFENREIGYDDIIFTGLTDTTWTFDVMQFIYAGWLLTDNGGGYFLCDWTVYAIGGEDSTWAVNGPFELEYFQTDVAETAGAGLPQNDLLIYPNPANAQATVAITLAQPSEVTVNVTDVLGRQVFTLPQGQMMPGVHRVPLDLNQYPSGTYMIRVDGDSDIRMTRRLVVVK
jgi:outer membrane protein assembly factor BamB